MLYRFVLTGSSTGTIYIYIFIDVITFITDWGYRMEPVQCNATAILMNNRCRCDVIHEICIYIYLMSVCFVFLVSVKVTVWIFGNVFILSFAKG